MKKLIVLLATALLIMGASPGFALTFDYTHDADPNVWINNDDYAPDANNWYQLLLPDWYDSTEVTVFTIDFYGYGDDSTKSIDVWADLGAGSPGKIVGYDVQNGRRPFVLRMDLVNGDLYRNYQQSDSTWTGFIDTSAALSSWPSLADFDGLGSFLIGYACHFYYDKTSLHIEQHPVPEPSSMLLLGFGLVGLAGVRRKFLRH